MSYKLHFLFLHLKYFPENLGESSEVMSGRFYQGMKWKEKHMNLLYF